MKPDLNRLYTEAECQGLPKFEDWEAVERRYVCTGCPVREECIERGATVQPPWTAHVTSMVVPFADLTVEEMCAEIMRRRA